MTAAQRRKKRRMASSARVCSELAFLGALLFHAALFWAFRVEPSTETRVVVEEVPECVFLRPYDWARTWEKELYTWANVSNPALLIVPNQQHGFAKVRRTERMRPVTDVPGHTVPEIPAAETAPPLFELPSPLATVTSEIHSSWEAARPPVPEPHEPARIEARVFWRWPDGTELERIPEIAPETIRSAVSASSTALSGPTRIEIDRAGAFPRVHVRARSGVLALDDAVVSALRRELFRLERYPEQGAALYSCIPLPGKASVFEVEWRSFLRPVVSVDVEVTP